MIIGSNKPGELNILRLDSVFIPSRVITLGAQERTDVLGDPAGSPLHRPGVPMNKVLVSSRTERHLKMMVDLAVLTKGELITV